MILHLGPRRGRRTTRNVGVVLVLAMIKLPVGEDGQREHQNEGN